MANRAYYGFRYHGTTAGACTEKPIVVPVATGYQASISATSVDLRVGDPVHKLSDGTWEIAEGTEGTPDVIDGIIVGVKQYWDGAVKRSGYRVPGGTAYGTNYDRETQLLVQPARGCIWRIRVDENTTATTYAGYRAFLGENADHVLQVDTTDSNEPKADPELDIGTHAVTQGLQWRIIGIYTEPDTDFSADNVSLLVVVNESGEAPGSVTTTGV